ncbi:MAG: galactose-1-phosphate uridylyltransferase [Caldiserica bacterium]|nr:galactose-1-phosphate uridylyltransferase [Caldisericota bacterium]MDH7562166.1 galactose-1-phosphate uridylyltransferase [Caldisericota bacterium]
MKITFVTAEAAPFSKVGGLGDVASSLPKALSQKGHDLSVILPGYSTIPGIREMEEVSSFTLSFQGRDERVTIRKKELWEVKFLFLENEKFLSREKVYGYPDDALRFAFFSRAVLESLKHVGFPELLHLHDWHTCPIFLYLGSVLKDDPDFSRLATVFTIHNLAFQGIQDPRFLQEVGIPLPPGDERVEFFGKVNLLKAGILSSDMVTTVSETYAREIQTPALGLGLEGVLALRKKQLVGIVNGIDTEEFDPAEFGYKPGDPISFKEQAKKKLQERLQLKVSPATPLLSMVSRLTDQKGLDLFPPILDRLMERDVQLVILGQGEERYEGFFKDAQIRFPEKISFNSAFDPDLAKLIYAGSDIFLMPSRFEPCGLGQLIAMRYGTIPVVRKTGGLADTVAHFDREEGTGNGFQFTQYDPRSFLDAICECLEVYGEKNLWAQIVRNALSSDFSWGRAVPKYEEVYRRAIYLHLKKTGAVNPPEIRKDPILEEWAIIAKGRTKRPSDYKSKEDEYQKNQIEGCPFCPGNEKMTPDELYAFRPNGGKPNSPGWEVRVFDNKFPALMKSEEPQHGHSWLFTHISGVGAHEVIVETPDHHKDLPDLSFDQLAQVIKAFRERYRVLSLNKDLRYILIFRNHGRSAGASLSHPHSQLIATPIVPRRIKEELDSAHTFYEHTGECIFCALIREELEGKSRLILENGDFLAFAPYASRFPFETTIIPKRHQAAFSDLENGELQNLAGILREVLGRLKTVVQDPPYNMMIHSAPLGFLNIPYYHWHIEIIPRLTTPAGFEWGTDFYINPTPPEEAARFLREGKI